MILLDELLYRNVENIVENVVQNMVENIVENTYTYS